MQPLIVDPAALTAAGTAFGQASTGLSNLGADAPLAEAAHAVNELQTGAACLQAQAAVAAAGTAVAEATRSYATNLATAADRYQAQDQASAQALKLTM
ncbi:type VII secretion target [Mycobacterium sp. AMU20-3851]|uniref:type VII secretion target n=1 Tax=Mycobacterium sp. AMU20-3851 TaxID=3122055 RepID=UPI003754F36E